MTTKRDKAQLAIVGAGPGGYPAAFLAADLGVEVTLIDPEADPGGVCLFRGCIPSKALLHVAHTLFLADHARAYGLTYSRPEIDLGRIREWKDQVLGRQAKGLAQVVKAKKIRYIRGRANLLDESTLSIDHHDGQSSHLAFDHAILATGALPIALPQFPQDQGPILDSTSALDLPEVPETLLVVGGGYIGLEMATVYAALGSRVTVVEMTSGLLPGVDRDMVAVLQRHMQGSLEAIRLDTKVEEARVEDKGVRVTMVSQEEGESSQTYDRVLVAVGRRANTEGLGLDRAGVELDERGFVRVNAQRRTTSPHIYAIGDLTGEPMLAHKATHEGLVAAEAIAGRKVAYEPRAMPAVVYTDPEIAWCGVTEDEARRDKMKVKIAKSTWRSSGRALIMARDEGRTKVLVDEETGRLLGVGIVGVGAGELITEAVLAMEMAATAEDLWQTIHPHPTLSETIREATRSLVVEAEGS